MMTKTMGHRSALNVSTCRLNCVLLLHAAPPAFSCLALPCPCPALNLPCSFEPCVAQACPAPHPALPFAALLCAGPPLPLLGAALRSSLSAQLVSHASSALLRSLPIIDLPCSPKQPCHAPSCSEGNCNIACISLLSHHCLTKPWLASCRGWTWARARPHPHVYQPPERPCYLARWRCQSTSGGSA